MARTVVLTARASNTSGQTERGHSLRRQFEAQRGWPNAECHEVPVGQLGAERRRPERNLVDG
jgi:hypothetical protein